MKQYKIRYTKKVTKTVVATETLTADSPEQARRLIARDKNARGKVLNVKIEITEFEVKDEAEMGGLGR